MSQSLSHLLVHLVFSTQDRKELITKSHRDELQGYLVGILQKRQCRPIIIRAVGDHIHLLFVLSKNLALAPLVAELKANSSRWMKGRGQTFAGFRWQNGYGAFAVSASQAEKVRQYIAEQERHHRKTSFQEELRMFLGKHGVEYDERYLWD